MKWKMSRLKMSKCQEFHLDKTELSRYFLPILVLKISLPAENSRENECG